MKNEKKEKEKKKKRKATCKILIAHRDRLKNKK
jgi:hypothetical protein